MQILNAPILLSFNKENITWIRIMSKTNSWNFEPIAFFKCTKQDPIDAAQQGALDLNSFGSIDLAHLPQWHQMIESLDGFSHLWLIFVFHNHSQKWKPKVWPPRSPKKVGVFASRSPYRPNPIGISAVELVEIRKSTLFIKAHDLLNETPLLDIKPYLSYADSWPHSKNGWIDGCQEFQIQLSDKSKLQIEFLKHKGIELESIIHQQLRFSPTEKNKKRVSLFNEEKNLWILSIRTWRILWHLSQNNIYIENIYSGYSASELSNSVDKYNDKNIHSEFTTIFL
jgi:tRNA-Thr(GGU) m(6)t(6)A37 methyltransferase TsaA